MSNDSRSGANAPRRASAGGGKARARGIDRDDAVAQLSGPLGKVLDRLPATQRRVLELRMGLVDGHPQKLTEVASQLGMTIHEAKQIEQRAFAHIREVVPLDRLQKLLKN